MSERPRKFKGDQILLTLTPKQTILLGIMSHRLGAKNKRDGLRRVIEALWAAHEVGAVNLDEIRYTRFKGAVVDHTRDTRKISEWLGSPSNLTRE